MMLGYCESVFAGMGGVGFTAGGGAMVAALPPIGATGCPGFAGELAAGLFVCGEGGGALGAKNFAQAIITTMDNNEATKILSSGRKPLSFCGSLTNESRPS